METILTFVCWIIVIALMASFFLGLAVKWGLIEFLQVHAPNDFLNRLFSCKFCCSFWMSVAICIGASIGTGDWILMLVPFCSTVIARELW